MKKFLTILISFLILFPVADSALADLNDGLVAYYPFNGNANDESGNGNHGIIYGAVLTQDRFGQSNKAFNFDGLDDYISIANSSVFSIHNELTLTMWINASSFDNLSIMSKWKTESGWQGSWVVGLDDTGYPKFMVTGDGYSGQYVATSGMQIELNKYYHLACTYNFSENKIRIFVNGIERGSAPGQSGSIFVSNSKILIGAHIYNITSGHREKHFNGDIDEVRIYNRALSENEILELYQGAITLTVPETVIEGDGVLKNQGIISISQPLDHDLTIDLVSDDTSEVTVPDNVTIYMGSTSAAFDIIVHDDPHMDGNQEADIRASAETYTETSAIIQIIDDDTGSGGDIDYEYSYYLPYFTAQNNHWTGIALKNGNRQTIANVQVIIFNSNGNIQGTDEIIILPRGQNSFVVGTGLTDVGWLKVNSDQPLSGLSFAGTIWGDNYMADIPFMHECSTVLELPHVAQGPVFDTYVILCNPNPSPTTVTFAFVNTKGKIAQQLDRSLTGNGSCIVNLLDMVKNPDITNTGSIEISATNPVAAFGLYENLKSGGYCYAGINAVIPEVVDDNLSSP